MVLAVLLWGFLALILFAPTGASVALGVQVSNQTAGVRKVILVIDGKEIDRDDWIAPERMGHVPIAGGESMDMLRNKQIQLISVDRLGARKEFWSGTTDELIDNPPQIVIRD